MAKPPRSSDLAILLKGLSRVGSAVAEVRSSQINKTWTLSSIRPLLIQGVLSAEEAVKLITTQPKQVQVSNYSQSVIS